jgi:hypothetical protein
MNRSETTTLWGLPFAAVIILLLFLNSCSCNYHLKRAESKCGKTVFKDTIHVYDTLRINSVSTHTVFKFNQTDTVIVKEGRLTMKYFYHDSLVYLSGKCDTVFLNRIIKVPYEKTVLNFNVWSWIRTNLIWIIIFSFLAFVCVIVYKVVLK